MVGALLSPEGRSWDSIFSGQVSTEDAFPSPCLGDGGGALQLQSDRVSPNLRGAILLWNAGLLSLREDYILSPGLGCAGMVLLWSQCGPHTTFCRVFLSEWEEFVSLDRDLSLPSPLAPRGYKSACERGWGCWPVIGRLAEELQDQG